jgi:hypothetical protein
MNGRAGFWIGAGCAVLSWIGISVADESTPQVEQPASASIGGADENTRKPSSAETSRKTCVNQCNLANGNCNSEVRRARQECSRNAANGGRDPMTMRNNDYTYFCSYFRNPGYPGPGNFDARFAQHYRLCINLMQESIASMRYDCYRNERDTQNICRTELRDCQASCQ